MNGQRWAVVLVGLLIAGPVVILLTLGMALLLSALGDEVGAQWLGRLAALGGVVWGADLVALVTLLGIQQLGCCSRGGSSES